MKNLFIKYINKNSQIISKSRIKMIFLTIGIVFLIIISRILYISLKDVKQITIQAIYENQNAIKRNNIVDRNGIIIAADIKLMDFYLNREFVSKPMETAKKINEIFPEINIDKLYKSLINDTGRKKFVLIKRDITKAQKQKIINAGIVGVDFPNTIGRIYPHKNLFSHIVGFINLKRNGVLGLEKQYNNYLTNPNNDELELTLDIRIQTILRNQLLNAIKKYDAKSAIGIISELKTGNILAIVNLPDFNPNNIRSIKQDDFFNRATFGLYEMGSIFKIFTIAYALDSNIIKQNQKFDMTQIINYGKYEIKQEEYSKKYFTAEDILVRSSNLGAALIGMEIGNERMQNFLNFIGMFDKIPINFPELGKPLIPKVWRDINTITTSYGYGIAISPLHVVMAVGGIINNGILKLPRFTTIENYKDKEIIDNRTSQTINQYLRNVVKYGTGWRANALGYSVGGKTGSARLLKNGEYQENNIMANFVGAFPMNDPTFLIYIMIETPKNKNLKTEISGGTIAAPIFARIVESIAPILNVVPYVERIEE